LVAAVPVTVDAWAAVVRPTSAPCSGAWFPAVPLAIKLHCRAPTAAINPADEAVTRPIKLVMIHHRARARCGAGAAPHAGVEPREIA
jgi:hypothetical protein